MTALDTERATPIGVVVRPRARPESLGAEYGMQPLEGLLELTGYGDLNLAEDVGQEVYFEIWRRADKYDSAMGSAITWMQTSRTRGRST